MRLALCSAFVILGTALCGAPALAVMQGAVRIDQISPKSFGTWTLFSASGTVRTSNDAGINKKSQSFGLSEFGPTTLSVKPPAGMSAKISVYRGNELTKVIDTPQHSFVLYPNGNERFLIQYALSRLGSVGVTSDPPHVRFRMKGPTSKIYAAATPFTFVNIPVGQYSILMAATPECLQPAPHSAIVASEQRNTVHITLNCERQTASDGMERVRPTKRTLTEYAQDREYNARGNRK